MSEIEIENIKIDNIKSEYIEEFKKSNKSIEATKMQLLFYLKKK